MALYSINVSIKNNPIKGGIEIISIKNEKVESNIDTLTIYKRKHGIENDYYIFDKISITDFDLLNYHCIDISTQYGVFYDYYFTLTNGQTIIESKEFSNIECWFDGLIIGNEDRQYLAPLNCDTSITKNTQVNYVTTLSGRTPYRVSNASTNYVTGQTSALFTPLDEENQPIAIHTIEYINEVVDFLSDGTEKIIKLSSGGMWYVSIDSAISVPSNENYIGNNMVSFDWTEIGDVPELKKVEEE